MSIRRDCHLARPGDARGTYYDARCALAALRNNKCRTCSLAIDLYVGCGNAPCVLHGREITQAEEEFRVLPSSAPPPPRAGPSRWFAQPVVGAAPPPPPTPLMTPICRRRRRADRIPKRLARSIAASTLLLTSHLRMRRAIVWSTPWGTGGHW